MAARTERRNRLDDFDETLLELKLWVGRYLGESGRLGAGFSYFQMQAGEAGHTLTADNRDHLFGAGISSGFDSRDRWGDPHRGWLNEVRIVKTGGLLPGDGDFWSGIVDVRRYQLLATVEYRWPLIPSREFILWNNSADLGLSGALFADTGVAWTQKRELVADRAKSGFGFGLRLLLPAVEMTRLDVGFDGSGNWRLHFAVFSKMTAQRSRLR